MDLDRTVAPEVKIPPYLPCREPHLIHPLPHQKRTFYCFGGREEPYLRLQFYFPFSSSGHPKPPVPSLVMNLLKEGTRNRTMQEVADAFDFYGTQLSGSSDDQFTVFSIAFLKKYTSPLLDLLSDVFLNPSFESSSLQRLLIKRKQHFLTQLNKTSFLSKREMKRLFFRGTILERLTEESDFENIHREDIVSYFNQHYLQGPSVIVITGGKEQDFRFIIDYFEKTWNSVCERTEEKISVNPASGIFTAPKPGALQTSIRLKKEIPPYHHPDFPCIYFLNQWLGGYFGSRLMKNIREEKGYTYGIGSSINNTKNILHLNIHTEVGAEVSIPALNEILHEISLLSSEVYPEDERKNLAAYMAGRFLERTNGLFENANSYMRDHLLGINQELRHSLYHIFFDADTDRLRQVASRWLNPDEFTVVLAGDEKYIKVEN